MKGKIPRRGFNQRQSSCVYRFDIVGLSLILVLPTAVAIDCMGLERSTVALWGSAKVGCVRASYFGRRKFIRKKFHFFYCSAKSMITYFFLPQYMLSFCVHTVCFWASGPL